MLYPAIESVPCVKKDDKSTVSESPFASSVFADIEPFVVGPSEQDTGGSDGVG